MLIFPAWRSFSCLILARFCPCSYFSDTLWFWSIFATYFSKCGSIFGLYIEQKCSWTFCRHSGISWWSNHAYQIYWEKRSWCSKIFKILLYKWSLGNFQWKWCRPCFWEAQQRNHLHSQRTHSKVQGQDQKEPHLLANTRTQRRDKRKEPTSQSCQEDWMTSEDVGIFSSQNSKKQRTISRELIWIKMMRH